MLLSDSEKIIARLKQALEVKSDGQLTKYWCWPQACGAPGWAHRDVVSLLLY